MNILVTGASNGIGYQIVCQLAKLNNVNIIALSRNKKKLEILKNECKVLNNHANIIPFCFDLTEFDLKYESIITEIKKINSLDILINNAGYIVNKPFDEFSENEINDIFKVNFFAPAKLISVLLPYFNVNAHIINIGSMGGFQGSQKFKGLSYYSASKAALANLTECLAEELKDSKIFINCLALDAVQTEMLKKAFPDFNAPLSDLQMAEFIAYFALNGHHYFNGKIIPVALNNP